MDWTAAVFDPAPASAFIIENDLAPSPSYSCDPPNPAKSHAFTQDKSGNHQQLDHPPTASATTLPDREHRNITTRSPSPVLSIPGSWATAPTRATISTATSLPPPSRPRSTMAAAEAAAAAATATATAAPTPPPFDVARPWQHAMSMVSINAGLTPQFLLHAYYHAVARGPRPSFYHHQHHHHTYHSHNHSQPLPPPDRGWVHLDLTDHRDLHPGQAAHARRARDRGIRGVRVGYAGGDPGRVYLLAIAIDEVDPATGHGVVRLVTNTSVRHVLGGDEEGQGSGRKRTGLGMGLGLTSCADCPLWLPVRLVDPGAVVPLSGASGAGAGGAGPEAIQPRTATTQTRSDGGRSRGEDTDTESSPYQIIPCCDAWLDAMDFTHPLSAEERQASGVVDRLIREVQRMRLALLAQEREREVRHRDDEVARPRRGASVGRGYGWCGHGQEMDRGGVGDGVPVTAVPLRTWASDVDAMGQYWWAVVVVLVLILAIIYK